MYAVGIFMYLDNLFPFGQNKDKPLSKLLTRGEDAQFDQLLASLGSVAENCLPSLLRVLFEWYDRQNPVDVHRQGYRSWRYHDN